MARTCSITWYNESVFKHLRLSMEKSVAAEPPSSCPPPKGSPPPKSSSPLPSEGHIGGGVAPPPPPPPAIEVGRLIGKGCSLEAPPMPIMQKMSIEIKCKIGILVFASRTCDRCGKGGITCVCLSVYLSVCLSVCAIVLQRRFLNFWKVRRRRRRHLCLLPFALFTGGREVFLRRFIVPQLQTEIASINIRLTKRHLAETFKLKRDKNLRNLEDFKAFWTCVSLVTPVKRVG